MREINFRANRIDNNEVVFGHYVLDPKGNHRIYYKPFEEASSNTYHFVKPETVSEFTGFTDALGNDIYENDTVTFGDSKYDYTVLFDRGSFILRHNAKYLGNWGLLSRVYDGDFSDFLKKFKVVEKGEKIKEKINSDAVSE